MTTDFILSVDPGVSNGVALIEYDANSVPELVQGWQFNGGAYALKEFVDAVEISPFNDEVRVNDVQLARNIGRITVIAEKFTARNTKGFSYTTASLEPLRGEGVLLAWELMPDYTPKEKRWRDPGLQYLVGGKDLPDKKKRQHAFLKDIGFYRTNKDFPDSPPADGADDFRSAAAHGLAYLMREKKHTPTYDLVTEWTERNA